MNTRSHASVEVGEELPPLDVETTATIVAGGALASRDYTPVHHDKAAAQAQGLPDIFMNILTTNGFVGRFITDWAGPEALLRKVDIRLGAPNYPGDTMTLRGSVAEKADGVVTIKVVGQNELGPHVTGTVDVALPGAAAPQQREQASRPAAISG